MTVGSVRGKERLETPCRVAHEARGVGASGWVPGWAVGREAKSVGGQTRLVPALMDLSHVLAIFSS